MSFLREILIAGPPASPTSGLAEVRAVPSRGLGGWAIICNPA